ncbi:hypothetical protein HUT16_07100 [Kitasatospora sp. NA04385]|uniref:hypothetical protein n=1 Tax=Kitasatospora sp. NA04385 TaxID=2742135 RepID=UPI001590C59F|nr:hypothetical protein [Kitasatospora sp. NA04385]QKW18866.1 hypothetical protein HUT16_07100 [Kitasatospora sp. NA04385]
MRLSRSTVAAVLAASALALTACDPDGSGSDAAASAPAATAATAATTAASAPTASAAAKPTTGAKPSASAGKSTAAATGKATAPAADCTANAAGTTVLEATENAYSVHVWMRARSTRFVCGPDVANDGYWEPQGDAQVYEFANEVRTTLLDGDLKARSVDLTTFMRVQEACLKKAAPAAPYRCFGNQYQVELGAQNKVLAITQLYHP